MLCKVDIWSRLKKSFLTCSLNLLMVQTNQRITNRKYPLPVKGLYRHFFVKGTFNVILGVPSSKDLNFRFTIVTFKGSVREKWKGYRLTAKNNRFWSLLILFLSVGSIRRKLIKTTYNEKRSVHTNSENCNKRLVS